MVTKTQDNHFRWAPGIIQTRQEGCFLTDYVTDSALCVPTYDSTFSISTYDSHSNSAPSNSDPGESSPWTQDFEEYEPTTGTQPAEVHIPRPEEVPMCSFGVPCLPPGLSLVAPGKEREGKLTVGGNEACTKQVLPQKQPRVQPSDDDLAEVLVAIANNQDTTLMVSDLPGKLSMEKLVAAMDQNGFANTYDLVYMPPRKGCRYEKRVKSNLGFAFVNFKAPEYASSFANLFYSFVFPGYEKTSSVRVAKHQGFQANLDIHSKVCMPGSLVTFGEAGAVQSLRL